MKKISAAIMALLIILNISGCELPKKQEPNIEISKKNQLYIEVSALVNREHSLNQKKGLNDIGEELGVRTEYIGPEEYDINAMISAFEQAIAKKPNGILVVGFSPLLTSLINKAIDAGIPVATVESDLPESKRIAFVGTDNLEVGKVGGEKLANLINGKGKVAIITETGQLNHKEYINGYKEVFSKYPGIEIVQIIDAGFNAVSAEQSIKELVKKYPDLAGIVCTDAISSTAAATAVRETGMQGKLEIIGMDKESQVLKEIENGVISVTIVPNDEIMSYTAVKILYNLNNKVKSSDREKDDNNYENPVLIYNDTIVIDKYSLKDYKK